MKITPRSAVNRVVGVDGAIKITLTAPPVEGAANQLLVELLAGYANCPKATYPS